MKKYLIVLLLLTALFNAKAHSKPWRTKTTDNTLKMLPDGHYYADVSYYNYANSSSAEYNLKVKIKDGFVTVIFLNNGGIVHNGINYEGYMFTGGKIKVSIDKRSGKLEYTAQVSISNGAVITSYAINIEKEAADEGSRTS